MSRRLLEFSRRLRYRCSPSERFTVKQRREDLGGLNLELSSDVEIPRFAPRRTRLLHAMAHRDRAGAKVRATQVVDDNFMLTSGEFGGSKVRFAVLVKRGVSEKLGP